MVVLSGFSKEWSIFLGLHQNPQKLLSNQVPIKILLDLCGPGKSEIFHGKKSVGIKFFLPEKLVAGDVEFFMAKIKRFLFKYLSFTISPRFWYSHQHLPLSCRAFCLFFTSQWKKRALMNIFHAWQLKFTDRQGNNTGILNGFIRALAPLGSFLLPQQFLHSCFQTLGSHTLMIAFQVCTLSFFFTWVFK